MLVDFNFNFLVFSSGIVSVVVSLGCSLREAFFGIDKSTPLLQALGGEGCNFLLFNWLNDSSGIISILVLVIFGCSLGIASLDTDKSTSLFALGALVTIGFIFGRGWLGTNLIILAVGGFL